MERPYAHVGVDLQRLLAKCEQQAFAANPDPAEIARIPAYLRCLQELLQTLQLHVDGPAMADSAERERLAATVHAATRRIRDLIATLERHQLADAAAVPESPRPEAPPDELLGPAAAPEAPLPLPLSVPQSPKSPAAPPASSPAARARRPPLAAAAQALPPEQQQTLHHRLTDRLVGLAGQLKASSMETAQLLQRDARVLHDAAWHLDSNAGSLGNERQRLSTLKASASSTRCLSWTLLFTTVVVFFSLVLFVRLFPLRPNP